MRIKKIISNNLGLKMLAFLLAFVTWVYVGEATKVDSEKTVLQKLLSPTKYITKKLYVKPIFVGRIPGGYRLRKSEIKVEPGSVVVIGPSKILSKKEFIYTKPINLGEYTKSKMLDVELADISRSIKIQKTEVQILLAIEKEAQTENIKK